MLALKFEDFPAQSVSVQLFRAREKTTMVRPNTCSRQILKYLLCDDKLLFIMLMKDVVGHFDYVLSRNHNHMSKNKELFPKLQVQMGSKYIN